MIAFKTYAQAPTDQKPEGIPEEWPWILVSIQQSQQSQYEIDGYTVMQPEEYDDYLTERKPAFLIWAVAADYGSNPLKDLTDFKAEQGFEIYRSLVAMLDGEGGISSVDSGLAVYSAITPIRNMLKDGFFTYALRYYCKNVKPLNYFSAELDAGFIATLRGVCAQYGSTESELNNIENGESA